MAAPVGNDNKLKNKPWADAIARAVARKAKGDKDAGLNIIADQLVSAAINGDQWAIKEIGDRIDGKAAQSVALTNPEGGDLFAPLVSAAEVLRGKMRGQP